MNSRTLAAVLSAIVSELLLLLLLLFPFSSPLSITGDSMLNSQNFLPLIFHFLSLSQATTSHSILSSSRKRKRTHQLASDSETEDESDSQMGALAWIKDPDSFKGCFRMTSSSFEWLTALLEPLLDCRDPIGAPLNLSAQIRLGIGLFRLANGSDYLEISDRFGVSESVAKFCCKQLCRVLCTNFRFWVAFPSQTDLESVSTAFESLSGLPNCCGVIDCAQFKIIKDEGSISAQVVVDSSSKILSIFAVFRGNKDYYRVLRSSTLYKDIMKGNLLNSQPMYIKGVAVNQYLVGDEGYPLLPWLMVPYVGAVSGSSEENFNSAHNLLRLSSVRAITSLKNWGVLSRPIEEDFKMAVAYIGACSILHNVLLMREDYTALSDASENCPMDEISSQVDRRSDDNSVERIASAIRNALASRAREL